MMGSDDVPVVAGVVILARPTVLTLSAADICTAAIAPFRLCHARGRLAVGETRLGPDNNPANATRRCFIRALILLEAPEVFCHGAGGKNVQQRAGVDPCWTEMIRVGPIICYSASARLSGHPNLTHLHRVVATE